MNATTFAKPFRGTDTDPYRKIAFYTGLFWVITYITSIAAKVAFYLPVFEQAEAPAEAVVEIPGPDSRRLLSAAGVSTSSTTERPGDRAGLPCLVIEQAEVRGRSVEITPPVGQGRECRWSSRP